MTLLRFMLIYLSLLTGFAFGQKPKRIIAEKHTSAIKVNILSPFIGTLSLQYESKLRDDASLQLGLLYFSGQLFLISTDARGVRFSPEYRLYLSDDESNMQGTYIQPFFRVERFWSETSLRNTSSSSSKLNYNFTGIGGGLVIGRQIKFYNKVLLDMYIGPVYTYMHFDDEKMNTTSIKRDYFMFNGYWVRAGISLGFIL